MLSGASVKAIRQSGASSRPKSLPRGGHVARELRFSAHRLSGGVFRVKGYIVAKSKSKTAIAAPVERDWVKEVGAPAAASIVEMVAALSCDYDRLEELRAAKEEWAENVGGDDDEQNRTHEEWGKEFPDEAAELLQLEADAGECKNQDDARQRIEEDPLSIQVRSDWHNIGEDSEDAEFEILLTTGGPAVRIVGELDDGEVLRPRLEVQDWGKPWTEYFAIERDTLETYCGVFCFEH